MNKSNSKTAKITVSNVASTSYSKFMVENTPKMLAALCSRGDWNIAEGSLEVLEDVAIESVHRLYTKLAKKL